MYSQTGGGTPHPGSGGGGYPKSYRSATNSYKKKTENFVNNVTEIASYSISSGIDKIYNRIGTKDNAHIAEPLKVMSNSVEGATIKLQGFASFLQEASDKFAPLVTAVMALEGAIYTLQTITKVTSGISEILSLQNTINTVF